MEIEVIAHILQQCIPRLQNAYLTPSPQTGNKIAIIHNSFGVSMFSLLFDFQEVPEMLTKV